MIINNVYVAKGESKKIDVNIAKLPSHSSIDISIFVSRAKVNGPVLLLMGGLHGDEINGIEIVRRIIDNDYHIPSKGTIICIPILNIFGFINFSRYVPDGKDVNRSFPGNKAGSLAARVAHYFTHQILPMIDIGIDFHTGGADRTNYPQIRGVLTDPKVKELADVFYAPFSLHAAYRPNSLRKTAAKFDKRILVYEGGEASRFDEYAIQMGLDGTLRLMNYLNIRNDEIVQPNYTNKVFFNSSWVRAKVSGIFQKSCDSGDKVTKNQLLGHIVDPFGDFKSPIKSPATGYIIGINNNPILHQGDAIIHIGVKK